MHTINRLMTNICTADLQQSKSFYTTLFNLRVSYNSDWFVHLSSENQQFELGLIAQNHDLVPKAYQNAPQGFYLTFVVEDADALYAIAQSNSFEIVEPPQDTFYGQRRLLLKSPEGALIDISSIISDMNPENL